jgi:hypothetical protein
MRSFDPLRPFHAIKIFLVRSPSMVISYVLRSKARRPPMVDGCRMEAMVGENETARWPSAAACDNNQSCNLSNTNSIDLQQPMCASLPHPSITCRVPRQLGRPTPIRADPLHRTLLHASSTHSMPVGVRSAALCSALQRFLQRFLQLLLFWPPPRREPDFL